MSTLRHGSHTPAKADRRGLADERRPDRDAVFAGHFPPGPPLREVDLRRGADVSRGSAREGPAMPGHEGLVGGGLHRPTTVVDVTAADVEEVIRCARRWTGGRHDGVGQSGPGRSRELNGSLRPWPPRSPAPRTAPGCRASTSSSTTGSTPPRGTGAPKPGLPCARSCSCSSSSASRSGSRMTATGSRTNTANSPCSCATATRRSWPGSPKSTSTPRGEPAGEAALAEELTSFRNSWYMP